MPKNDNANPEQIRRNALIAAAKRAAAPNATAMDKLEFSALRRLDNIIRNNNKLTPADAQMALDCQRVMVMAARMRQEREVYPRGNGPLAQRLGKMTTRQLWQECHADEVTTRQLLACIPKVNNARRITKQGLSDFVVFNDAARAATIEVKPTMDPAAMTPEQRKAAASRMQLTRNPQPTAMKAKAPAPKLNAGYVTIVRRLMREQQMLNQLQPKNLSADYQNIQTGMMAVTLLWQKNTVAKDPEQVRNTMRDVARLCNIYERRQGGKMLTGDDAKRLKMVSLIKKDMENGVRNLDKLLTARKAKQNPQKTHEVAHMLG